MINDGLRRRHIIRHEYEHLRLQGTVLHRITEKNKATRIVSQFARSLFRRTPLPAGSRGHCIIGSSFVVCRLWRCDMLQTTGHKRFLDG
jgi:hypothetical protein